MKAKLFLVILGGALTLIGVGCGVEPPVPVPAVPPCALLPGQSTALAATGGKGATTLEWHASAGQLTPNIGPAVTYTAPMDYSGSVIITIIAKRGNSQAQGEMTCTILAPPTSTPLPPTATFTPTPTMTSTSIPGPISCINPAVTKNVFALLADVEGQFPIYGPVTEPNFTCEGVYDLTYSGGQLAVRLKYEQVGSNYGYWGIATPNGYDASSYSEICFWAYAQEPNQPFYLKMKDTSGLEKSFKVFVEGANEWEQICTPLNEFSKQGVKLNQMENVNLGFDTDNGSAEVWVGDFEFTK